MTTVASAFIELVPTTAGWGRKISTQVGGELDRAGADGGKRYGDAMGKGVTDNIKGQSASLGQSMKGLAAGVVAGFAAAGIGDLFNSAIEGASDLAETVSKSGVIFGKNAGAIDAWASGAAKNLGLSRQAALDAASGFGNMFSQLGFSADQASGMSESVVQLSADLGSFNNLPTAQVSEMISGAFRGEYDSLQRLVPNINAARVEQEALSETHKTSAQQLTAAEKATAVLAIVQKDGAAAAGDFARTSDGVANKTKIQAAEMDNLRATIGEKLLPIQSAMLDAGLRITDWMSNNLPVIGGVAAAVAGLGLAYAGTAAWIALTTEGTVANTVVTGIARAASATWTAAQWLLNAALSANPIGLVVIGLAALVAGLVYAWNNSETFRSIVLGAWAAIQAGVMPIVQWLITAVPQAFSWIKEAFLTYTPLGVVISHWTQIRDFISGAVDTVKRTVSGAWENLQTTTTAAWGGIVTAVKEKWNGLTDAISGPVKSVMTWVKEHFVSPINDILSKVGVDFRIPFPQFDTGGVVHALASSYDVGGWTGPGSRLQPAGVVHADEFVVKKDSQNRMRNQHPGVLDYINDHGTLPGFADGGLVGFISNAVSNVGRFLSDPVGAVGDMVRGLLDGSAGSNMWAQVATSAMGHTISGLVEKVKTLFTAGGVGTAQDLGNGRVSVAGHLLDATTNGIFQKASAILGGLNLMQGSWSTSVGASGGTHAGAGAMDVWPSNGNWKHAVDVLRSLGDVAWHRVPAQGPWAEHIHGITPGVAGLSAAAASQVASFRSGGNGLASGGPDNNGYWAGGRVKLPVFDNGGTLAPGVNTVFNNTGGPEALVRADRPQVLHFYDTDGVLLGTIRGVARKEVGRPAALASMGRRDF